MSNTVERVRPGVTGTSRRWHGTLVTVKTSTLGSVFVAACPHEHRREDTAAKCASAAMARYRRHADVRERIDGLVDKIEAEYRRRLCETPRSGVTLAEHRRARLNGAR